MKNLTTIMILFLVIALMGFEINSLQTRQIITPVNYKLYVQKEKEKEDKLVSMLLDLGASKENVHKISSGIRLAEQVTGTKPKMTAAILATESEFVKTAKSPKGYKGLMQTPVATYYEEVDILYGAMIFQEKLRNANGDTLRALALYKGGDNPAAWKEARKTMALYIKLKNSYQG